MPDSNRGEALLSRTAAAPGGEHTLALALAVCLAVRVEPALLRRARRRLVLGADAGAESDLWFSPLVLTRNRSGLVLDGDVLTALRRRVADGAGGAGFAQDARAVVSEAHVDYPEPLKLEEDLVWEALLSERDPARPSELGDGLRSAVKALVTDADGGRQAAAWAAQAWRRIPAAAQQTEVAGLLAIGASLRLGTAVPVVGLNPVRLPASLGWLTPSEGRTPVPLGVEVTDTTLRFVEPTDDGNLLEFPPTTPLVAEIASSDGTSTTSRLEQIAVGRDIELGRVVGSITLRTLSGRRYTIEPVLAAVGGDAEWRSAAQLERACVAVRSADGVAATGYFVAPDLVATSAAIDVTDIQWGARWWAARLRLRTTAPLAVVEVLEPPADARPLDLDHGDVAVEDGVQWVSCGFPDGVGASRTITGMVRGGRFELDDPASLPGLAGAPVLVNGRLVGQVRGAPFEGAVEITAVTEVRHALARARQRTDSPPPGVLISSARDVSPDFVDQLRNALQSGGFQTPRRDPQVGDAWADELDEELLTCDAAVVLVSRVALDSAWFRREIVALRLRLTLTPGFRLIPVLMGDVTVREIRASAVSELSDTQLLAEASAPAIVAALEGVTAGPDRRMLLRRLREVLRPLPASALARGAGVLGVEADTDVGLALPLALLERSRDVDRVVAFARALQPELDGRAADELSRVLRLLLVRPEAATAMRRTVERDAAALVSGTSAVLARLCAELAWLERPAPSIVDLGSPVGEDQPPLIDAIRARRADAGNRRLVVILRSPFPQGGIVASIQRELPEVALILVESSSSSASVLAPAIVQELGMPLGVATEQETLIALAALERLEATADTATSSETGRDREFDPAIQNLEFKITVLPAEEPLVQAELRRVGFDPARRRVYYYDTPELALFARDLVLRARVTDGDDDDSTVKLRPLPLPRIPAPWSATEGVRIELDVVGSRQVPSAKLDGEPDAGEIEQVAHGMAKLSKLFSKAQQAIVADELPSGTSLNDLAVLGPVEARKWELPPETFPHKLNVEEWSLPDGTQFLELSFKVEPGEARSAEREFHSLLDRLGIGHTGDPVPKTSRVLKFFAERPRSG